MNSLYSFSGVVQEGHKRGKKLGFPTLNMQLEKAIPEGIYVSQTQINTVFYHSITFIGAAKTYDETEILAETYVFDFNDEIYGEQVTVLLLKKLRDNQKFESEEALKAQMEIDKGQALDFFSSEQTT